MSKLKVLMTILPFVGMVHVSAVPFKYKKDREYYEVSYNIGIGKDDVVFSTPCISKGGCQPQNCHCGANAEALVFKDKVVTPLCKKHYNEQDEDKVLLDKLYTPPTPKAK